MLLSSIMLCHTVRFQSNFIHIGRAIHLPAAFGMKSRNPMLYSSMSFYAAQSCYAMLPSMLLVTLCAVRILILWHAMLSYATGIIHLCYAVLCYALSILHMYYAVLCYVMSIMRMNYAMLCSKQHALYTTCILFYAVLKALCMCTC